MATIIKNLETGNELTIQNATTCGDHLLYQARLGVPRVNWQVKNHLRADGKDENGRCILRPVDGYTTVEKARKPRAPRKAKSGGHIPTPKAEPTTKTEPVSEPQTEPEPSALQHYIDEKQKQKVTVPTMTQAESALSTLFAGVADRVTMQVMEKAQPILDEIAKERGRVVRHEFKDLSGTTTKVEGVQHHKFDMVAKLVYNNLPVYLWGPAGTGKTDLVRSVAKALGLDYYQASKVTEVFTLTGFVDANGNYIESDFFKAFTKGGIYLFDEMDASDEESLVAFNAAVSQRCFSFPKVGMVQAHPDFRVVGAGNTGGTGANEAYTGRRALDASTLNRFFYVEIDYDKDIEKCCARGDEEIVNFIHDLRKAAERKGITIVLSYRNITAMATLKGMFSDEDILRGCVIKEKDRDAIYMLLDSMTTSSRWTKALRNCAS